MKWPIRRAVAAVGLLLGGAALAGAAPWVDVDTDARTLTVYDVDGSTLGRFTDIAVGSGGVAELHLHGDHTTPRGRFHIVEIRPSQSFDTFILLDYPRPEHADKALDDGRIDAATRDRIATAAAEERMPPQDTELGGEIGIHGLGRGSLRVHRMYNWTSGCVALTNEQIHRLAALVRPGVAVLIH